MTAHIVIQSHHRTRQSVSTFPLVLIHGWGNDSRVWGAALPRLLQHFDVLALDLPGFGQSLPCRSWQQALEEIIRPLPEKFFLMGWSLGGMLAVQLATRFPDRVLKLVTLASNASFVSRSGWSAAMPPGVFDEFYQGFLANPAASIKQFTALEASGDKDERNLLRWMRANSPEIAPVPWLNALDWLKQLDNREALAQLKIPSLHLFGVHDQLVPAGAATQLARLSKKLDIRVLDDAGHAPHISQPEIFAEQVIGFLGGDEKKITDLYQIKKQQIAYSFSRAASSYDEVAQLQRNVGKKLQNLVPGQFQPTTIADVGCGTGYFSVELTRLFPGATYTGIDMAPGMLKYAAEHHGPDSEFSWLCGDAEALPIEETEFDLVFSNFTFQWCQNLKALMAEQWRILRPGGLLLFTTVGPNTLWQLRQAWQEVDQYVHVNQFVDLKDVETAVTGQGFQILHWEEETLIRHYSQLSGLTRELKALGAHNLNQGRNSGLTGRARIERLKSTYEGFRTEEGLPADWEILFVAARKPAELAPC